MPRFIIPSTANFTYKQGETLPPAQVINHTFFDPPVAINVPSWIDIYDITASDFKVRLNSTVNYETPGNHNHTIIMQVAGYNEEDYLFINLTLQATQFLEVSPNAASFTFITGGSNPAGKVFSILSENSWTISKNATWLSVSTASGSNNGSFTASVNAVGLSPGTYNDNITVDDGGTPVVIPVSLTVSDADTGSDYLNIYPTTFNFNFTEGGALPNAKSTDVNASASFTASTAQSWINVNPTSGSSGNSSVTISLQNLGSLSVGNHVGYVDFAVGNIVKRATVNLTIYELISQTLTPGLYFCDDENIIKVSSSRGNTSLLMTVASTFEGQNNYIDYLIPFFNGVAQKRVGAAASNILGDRPLIGFSTLGVITPYLPLLSTFTINEVDTITKEVFQTITLNNIQFLKGKKPPTAWMSNLPNTIFLTKEGTLIFSVLSNGQAAGDLVLSGAVTQTITNSTEVFEFYTVVVPLNTFSHLTTGDSFTATLLNQSITVVIAPPSISSVMLYSETQWGTFEPFELTGEVVETSNYKDDAYTFRKDHLTTETKVFSRKKRKAFKINTGYLYSQTMLDYLDVFLESENFYLNTNNFSGKVRCTTKKAEIRKSLAENFQADLTFEDVLE